MFVSRKVAINDLTESMAYKKKENKLNKLKDFTVNKAKSLFGRDEEKPGVLSQLVKFFYWENFLNIFEVNFLG